MCIDLHVHTNVSDGAYGIEKTLKIAHESGITHIAITNHDTVEELAEAVTIGIKLGIEVIPGIEISAKDPATGKAVHILGYNFALGAKHIKQLCTSTLHKRQEKSLWQIDTLINNGYKIDKMSINVKRKGRTIYKQHIMEELVLNGYTDKIYSDLYERLFKGQGVCVGGKKFDYPDAAQAVKAIRADGGIAILAHPGAQESLHLVKTLVSVGLNGIELVHSKNSDEVKEKIIELAQQYDLLVTGGSDFHGKYDTVQEFGSYLCPQGAFADFQKCSPNYFYFIQELVFRAGVRLLEYNTLFKDGMCKNGDATDLVTEFDIKIEKFLADAIRYKFPSHGFITEEKVVNNVGDEEYTWIIDPIDGTTNFISCGKDFAISIALYKAAKPVMGVVYDVMSKKMYVGVKGAGALLNGKAIKRISGANYLQDAVVDCSLRSMVYISKEKNINFFHLAGKIRAHRSSGCASLAICKIAQGLLDVYLSAYLYIWDYAAARIILEEMHGVMVLDEQDDCLDKVITKSFCAAVFCNQNIAQDFLKLSVK
ncbi:MAG: PHP domain-containing protein [Acidaminococcaceae bacterium]|nr:PHP domain-containing protein [Acidaminococcaceae bacterium]